MVQTNVKPQEEGSGRSNRLAHTENGVSAGGQAEAGRPGWQSRTGAYCGNSYAARVARPGRGRPGRVRQL